MPVDSLTLLDLGLRFAALGIMFINMIVIGISRAEPALKMSFVFLFFGALEYLTSTSLLLYQATMDFRPYLHFFGSFAPLGFWVFALYLFEEKPPWKLSLLLFFLILVHWALRNIVPEWTEWVNFTFRTMVFAMVIHIFYLAVSGHGDDLIEKRRQIRLWLALYMGFLVIVLMSTEYLLDFAVEGPPRRLKLAITATGATLVSAILASVALLRTDRRLVFEPAKHQATVLPTDNLSASERILHDKLMAAMDGGHYRSHALSIKQLAEHLETPEHRLRALINQRLGHRNFSSFLNGYRIAEAKEKLSNPEHIDLPVLTMAMDLGYGSLTPFNRAFRAETGQSPREFRKNHFDQN